VLLGTFPDLCFCADPDPNWTGASDLVCVSESWKSDAASELHVPRPTSSELIGTAPQALDRLKKLTAEGIHDQWIAELLNVEGWRT
jgi:hypothetical protein